MQFIKLNSYLKVKSELLIYITRDLFVYLLVKSMQLFIHNFTSKLLDFFENVTTRDIKESPRRMTV